VENAIQRHGGEARHVEHRFDELTPKEKQALIAFLNSR
jgi:CxxC motif-containing protein (DUF1111 family)